MLSAAFFFSVFLSTVWCFYSLSNLSGGEANHFAITVAVVFLPILILWVIFGYIYQYTSASILNKNMYSLFKQMKKNQETAEVIARALLEAKEEEKNDIVLGKFDIFIADMNELLSEIIMRCELVSAEQIDALWIKVKNGGKWAFGKVIIELAQKQPNLPNQIMQKALKEPVLGGTILEFCSRYQSLVNALEKHDNEHLFLNMVETGVLGKVFSLLALPADSIRQNRDLTLARKQMEETDVKEISPIKEIVSPVYEEIKEDRSSERLSESARRLFINTFRKKEVTPEPEVKDPLSMAFEKSFGNNYEEKETIPMDAPSDEEVYDEEDLAIVEESRQEYSEPEDNTLVEYQNEETEPSEEENSMPEIILRTETMPHLEQETIDSEPHFEQEKSVSEPHFESKEEISSVITPELTAGFQNTQEKLADIKKEWEEAKQRDLQASREPEPSLLPQEGMPEPKINKDNEFSYPFSGWMNTDNYEK